MKASVIQGFLRDWLAIRGLEPQVVGPDIWSFGVPEALQERLGCAELSFAFSRRALAKNPRAELATIGNPVFDRLLAVAREEGRIGVGHVKPRSANPRAPAPEKLGEELGLCLGKAVAVYQAVYHFVFSVSYPSIEAADEIEVVSVDGASLDVGAQTPDLIELWPSLEPQPRRDRRTLEALPLPDRILDAATRALERRMRRRIKKVEQTSEQRLEEETASIKAYYEQLIEEARNQSRRWSPRVEDREDRIRWLQLEWKRRTEEAFEFWRPQVNSRLVALGVMMVPRQAYPVETSKRKRRAGVPAGPMVQWDEATRSLVLPHCVECGLTGVQRPLVGGKGLCCPRCGDRAPEGPEQAKGDGRRPLTRKDRPG